MTEPLWQNSSDSGPLKREDLERAVKELGKPQPPHEHIVSPEGYRRIQQGGTALCFSCGALVGR